MPWGGHGLAVEPLHKDVALLYDALPERKDKIEALYGRPLSWEELPDKRASRVADYTDGDVANEDSYGQYVEWFIDAQDRLRKAVDAVRFELPL